MVAFCYLFPISSNGLYIILISAFWICFLHWYNVSEWKGISVNIRIYRQHVWEDAKQEVNKKLCNSVRMRAFPVWARCFYRKP